MLFFTISTNNYLAQCITLGSSIKATNPGQLFKIGIVDAERDEAPFSSIPFPVIEVAEIGIDNFEELYLKYSVTELCTAVKPFYFRYLFDSYPEEDEIIYLDPDTEVYGSLSLIAEELNSASILITPHFTNPINDELKQSEEDFLNSGLYNLGFIALKRSSETFRMLDWWGDRLKKKAFIDLGKGLFTDQIWINLVPLYFNNVKILLHPGYNMAYWNLHERELENNAIVVFKGERWPLIFFHFSGFSPEIPDLLSKYQTRFSFSERADVKELFVAYERRLLSNGYTRFRGIPCYYDQVRQQKEREMLLQKIKKIPLYKRFIRKLILKTISFFGIVLDYSRLK